jgi:hypothetical protein
VTTRDPIMLNLGNIASRYRLTPLPHNVGDLTL